MSIKYSSLEIALPKIQIALEKDRTRIYRRSELVNFIVENRGEWELPTFMGNGELIRLLLENTPLRMIQFTPVNHPNVNIETRYVWGANDPFQMALSIRNGCYLSHASAVYLHRLTHQVPRQIFVNKEQSVKPPSSRSLAQSGIARAFNASKQRSSQFVFRFEGGLELVQLSGKNTGRLEVFPLDIGTGFSVNATSLERTLIDIVVRPTYAGGVAKVLEAYEAARNRISVTKLIATLKQLNYVYPYHQVIGYYLQQAGVPENEFNQLKTLGLDFDFYLTYGMKESEYRSDWRLFVPKRMD
jgi:hypothetical protein